MKPWLNVDLQLMPLERLNLSLINHGIIETFSNRLKSFGNRKSWGKKDIDKLKEHKIQYTWIAVRKLPVIDGKPIDTSKPVPFGLIPNDQIVAKENWGKEHVIWIKQELPVEKKAEPAPTPVAPAVNNTPAAVPIDANNSDLITLPNGVVVSKSAPQAPAMHPSSTPSSRHKFRKC